MSNNKTLSSLAYGVGQYYLVDVENILKLYAAQGYNVDDEDTEVPNVMTVDGQECFFTGDQIVKGDKCYEIVIAAQGFSWDDVTQVDDDEEDLD